jgi:hypothetical protein
MDPRIGRNIPVEEYLALLDQQNKAKKAKDLADKERLEREERERGFNVFISGANQDRAIEQNKRNKAKDASKLVKATNEPVRRKWEAPNSASSRGKPNDDQYMNPFETHSDSFVSKHRETGGIIPEEPKKRK